MHTHSPNKHTKFKQSLANRKLMATVFWDRKEVLLIKFMEPGPRYQKHIVKLKKLCRAIENKMRGMLTSGVVLLHNARPQALLQKFRWDLFDHPTYSPDFAPSDFHLFHG